jgi:site-specific DNA recombinase
MNYIDFGLGLFLNLNTYFINASIEIQQKIIGSVFPDKLIFDGEKYRTIRKNELLELILRMDGDSRTGGKRKVLKNQDSSCKAPQVIPSPRENLRPTD